MNKLLQTYTYPWHTILISNTVNLLVYLSGIIILSQLTIWIALLFIGYILFLEFRVLKHSCSSCFYYGKWCAFGKGKLAGIFFKKGTPNSFSTKCINWKTMLPEMLVSIIPLLIGLYLLIIEFHWLILCCILIITIMSSAGNAFVRGKLACSSCKQKDLGCPAYDLFNQKQRI